MGTYLAANGARYDGEWSTDVLHGRGIYLWPTGDKYDGEWKFNKVDGRGTYEYSSGDRYQGEWVEGIKNGRGAWMWAEGEFAGDRYDGDWFNSSMQGRGVYYLTSGNRYEGEFVEDQKVGRGTFVCSRGLGVNMHGIVTKVTLRVETERGMDVTFSQWVTSMRGSGYATQRRVLVCSLGLQVAVLVTGTRDTGKITNCMGKVRIRTPVETDTRVLYSKTRRMGQALCFTCRGTGTLDNLKTTEFRVVAPFSTRIRIGLRVNGKAARWTALGRTFTSLETDTKVSGKKTVWTELDCSSLLMGIHMMALWSWTSMMERVLSHGVSASLLATAMRVDGRTRCVTVAGFTRLQMEISGKAYTVMTSVWMLLEHFTRRHNNSSLHLLHLIDK